MQFTEKHLEEIQRFASDDKALPSSEALEAFNSLYAIVQRNVYRNLIGTRKRNAMLQERMDKMVERREERILSGEFGETGLDSADVATALLYQLQQRKTYRLNEYKLQAILYEMYASWLNSKGERLFLEHPVATEFGPRFWRVFKRVDTKSIVPYHVWKAFAEKSPAVAAYCENAAKKYYDYAEGTLSRVYLASKPYKNAHKDNNNGKWGKELDDKEIRAWKEKTKF